MVENEALCSISSITQKKESIFPNTLQEDVRREIISKRTNIKGYIHLESQCPTLYVNPVMYYITFKMHYSNHQYVI